MTAIGVIAFNTFRESLRDKILYNLLFFAGLLIGLSVMLADLTITEHHKMIADMGLGAINLVGVVIAIFVGISLVNKEIERRTVYTIMARPISRASFILGKYTGLTLTLFINIMIMMAIFLLTVWFYRMPMTISHFSGGAAHICRALGRNGDRVIFFHIQFIDVERDSDAWILRDWASDGRSKRACREK